MNIWANGVITNKGLSLQAKLIEGTSLNITRAVTAAGYVTPGLLQAQADVTGVRQMLKFRSIAYPDVGKCALTIYLDNDELAEGYTAMQVGIYAEDPDEGEILYFICQAETSTGTIIPSKDEMPGYSAEWTFYFQYGQADDVTVVVDPAGAATIAMLEMKADKDFGNVTNNTFLEKAIISGAAIPIVHTTGTGEAYEADVPGMDELQVGMTFIMVPHISSTTIMPSLNVNGTGAKAIRQQLSFSTAATAPGSITTWLTSGKPCLVQYDGTLWKVLISQPAAAYLYGEVPVVKGGTGADNAEDARENLEAASQKDVVELQAEVAKLNDALFSDITGNPHTIDFIDLDGLVVTGVWNEAQARLEC